MGNSMTCGMLRRSSSSRSHGGDRARLVFCDGHVQEFERAVKAEEVMQVPYHWDAFIICESQDLSIFTDLIGSAGDAGSPWPALHGGKRSEAGKSEDLSMQPPHLAVHDVLQIGFTYFLLPTRIFDKNILSPSEPQEAKNPQAQAQAQAQAPPPASSCVWKPSLGSIPEVVSE